MRNHSLLVLCHLSNGSFLVSSEAFLYLLIHSFHLTGHEIKIF